MCRVTLTLGLLFACLSPIRAQDKHVDHEGFPLPAEAIARVGSARFRAASTIHWIAYSPDGKSLWNLSGGVKACLHRWDVETGKLAHRRELLVDETIHSGFAIAGGQLLYLGAEGAVHFHDANSGKEIRRCMLPNAAGTQGLTLRWAAFSASGNVLAVRGEPAKVRVFELAKGTERPRPKLHADSKDGIDLFGQTLALSSDGKTLLVASGADRIEVFDVETGNRRTELMVALEKVHHIALSPDGKDLFCTGNDQPCILVRDWAGKKDAVRLSKPAPFSASAFSPDGSRLAVTGEFTRGIAVFDAKTGKEVRTIAARDCWRLAFAPDGKTLATGNGINGCIAQWDVATGQRLGASADPPGGLRVDRFTDGDKHLLAYMGRHMIYDWKTGKVIDPAAKAESEYLHEAVLSPDGKLLAVRKEGKLLFLDAQTGKETHRTDNGMFVFTRAGKICIELKGAMHVLQEAQPRMLKGPPLKLFPTRNVAVSGDGRYLAAQCLSDPGYEPRVWDIDSGALLHRTPRGFDLHHPLTFSQNGRFLALAKGDAVDLLSSESASAHMRLALIDVRSGAELRTIADAAEGFDHLVFSPDDRSVATDGHGGVIRLWEVATGEERHRFEGAEREAFALVYSASGALLATSSHDAPVFIWDVYGKHAKRPTTPWGADEPNRLWTALEGNDAKAAFAAIRRLVQSPGPALKLLRDRLKPAPRIDPKHLEQRLRDLDSDDFETRQSAIAELERLGDAIEAALEQAAKGKLGLEATRRVQTLALKLGKATPERLARTRALEAVEQIATAESAELLEALAKGDPAARLTREARETLERVRKR